MVKTAAEIKAIVGHFVRQLETRTSIKVQKVILFGSYATGETHPWSDIDIAIISDDFRIMKPLDRIRSISPVVFECDHALSPFAYSLREYQRASPLTFLGEIKRIGKIIYEAN